MQTVLEALLFSAHEPVRFDKLREVLQVKPRELRAMLEELKAEYASTERAFQLDEVESGYLLRTKEPFARYIQLLHLDRRPERLSKAAMEILAIIAYRQPITCSAINELRGVDGSGTLATLVERGLVQRSGRPAQYATTERFLRQFGLGSLEELP